MKNKFTKKQQEAINSTTRWTALVAAAGSGKTSVLIERCLNLISENYENINHLLAITFTEKAASQLINRIKTRIPKDKLHHLENAWIGTFHSFCAKIIRSNAPLLNLDPSFNVLNENSYHLLCNEISKRDIISLLENNDKSIICLIDEFGFKNTLNLTKELLNFRWHTSELFSNTQKYSDKRSALLFDSLVKTFLYIKESLLKELESLNSLDFQGLEIKALELLKLNPEICNTYKNKFKFIVVDEYQDTSDIQEQILFLIADPAINNLAIVGDPRQSIYRFRGANVNCFNRALDKIIKANGKLITLDDNFRSNKSIIFFINALFDNLWNKKAFTFDLTPMNPLKDQNEKELSTIIIPISDNTNKTLARENEALEIALHINELCKTNDYKYSDIALLFQSMTNTSLYENAFKKFNIPFRFFGGRGFLEKQEICDLLNLLKYINNPNDEIALLGLLRSPMIGLSDDECVLSFSSTIKHSKTNLLDELKNLKYLMSPSEILMESIKITGYDIICADLDPSGSMLSNLERLICIAKTFEQNELITLTSFIDLISELRSKNARLGDPPISSISGNCISCMTVHASKGLEFPVLIMPDLIRNRAPLKEPWLFLRDQGIGFKLKEQDNPFGKEIETKEYLELKEHDKDLEEEELKRLLYVAMTRSMSKLIIPIHINSTTKNNWNNWLISCIKKISSELYISKSLVKYHTTTKDDSVQKESLIDNISFTQAKKPNLCKSLKIYTVSELEAYARCPYEYYLKYVIGVPSKKDFYNIEHGVPANIKGSIIHEVLQNYDPNFDSDISELIRTACYNLSIVPQTKFLAELNKPLSNFFKNPLAKKIDHGQRELRFDWKFNDSIITGTIDWLNENSKGFEIFDFKTDTITATQVEIRAKEYELQLATYAIAANQALNKDIISVNLFFLIPDIIVPIKFSNKSIQEYVTKISSTLNGIKNKDFELGIIEKPCYKCPYKHNKTCKHGR